MGFLEKERADVPKAVVLLDPPWDSVLPDDRVTLKCQGPHPAGDSTTQWLHNGSLLSSQAPAYTITAARAEDGGKYRCQTGLSSLSDPVQLRVHLGWLVLQAPRWVFQEGEPIQLRCHVWRNNNLRKVTYLHNGRGLRYFHRNSDLHIPEATRNHSGSYFCRGLVGQHNVSSETVTITVQGEDRSALVSRGPSVSTEAVTITVQGEDRSALASRGPSVSTETVTTTVQGEDRSALASRGPSVSTETVTTTVQGPANPVVLSSILSWHQIAFCLVMGLLLAADTGLFFSVQRDLRSSQRARKEHTLGRSLGSQDK